jgi:two-component system chemotaxis response regulator CheY
MSSSRTVTPRVLSVGQCGFDHRSIARVFAERLGAEVVRAHGLEDARAALCERAFDLVLVNRVLDQDGSSGLGLIQSLKEDRNPRVASVPIMLVSNYPDVQLAAQTLGACPGFGKSELHDPSTHNRLRALLSA